MDEDHALQLLIRRCVHGDAAAWEQLVRQFHRRIYNISFRFTGSSEEAEDLTQEVFIRMYRTLSSYDAGRAAFMTWVATLTRNLLVDHFRKTKQERLTDSLESVTGPGDDAPSLAEQLPDKRGGPDAGVQRRETRELVQAALQRLSPELREAVILRDLQDLDYKEIAQVLQVPEGTVKSRINRGRTELARLFSRTQGQGN